MPPNPENESANGKNRAPFSLAEELLAFAFIVIGIVLLCYAAVLAHRGGVFPVMEHGGLALMLFFGAFDPINFLWLCLPFTVQPRRPMRSASTAQKAIGIIGLFFLVVGWVCKHWWR